MKNALLLVFLTFSAIAQTSKIDQALALYEAKKYEEAKKILIPVKEGSSEYASAQYYLGRIAFDQNNLEDAQDYFEEAVDANDKVADYHNWLGNTYGSIARDANPIKQGILAPKMKSAWEKAIALDPMNIEARKSLIEYYTQAPGFMGGSFEKAHEVTKQIKKLNLAEGRVYSREKKLPEAEKEFIAMAKADPAYVSGLASFYANQKQYEKAFAIYDDELKKKPDNMLLMYQSGRLSATSGQRLDQGEAYLRKYLAYQPKSNELSHAGANMRLGQIMEKRGKKSEAKKLYETALKSDGSLKEAKEGLDRVSK
jgi:tetratricopeptide (TPR) repeat protein